MTVIRRPAGGNQGAGPDIEGYMSTKQTKKSPVRKIGKGSKKGKKGY